MFEYSIVRTRRKTLCISVTNDNEVIVRAPYHYPTSSIENFVLQKRNWVERVLKRNSLNPKKDEGVQNYTKIYIQGNLLPLTVGGSNIVSPDGIAVKNVKAVGSLVVKNFAPEFLKRMEEFSESSHLCASSVTFKNYKSRWGCCDSRNAVCFHFAILMLPQELQTYIMVHELCHTRHHNHSSAFWNEVAKYIPDYKARRKLLKDYSYLTRLY